MKSITRIACMLRIAVAAQVGLGSATVLAAPGADGPDSTKVTYDTSDLGSTFEGFGPEVSEAVKPLLHQAGHDDVRIRLYWKNVDEFHYGISVALEPEIAIEDAPEAATCRDCSSAMLQDAVVLGVQTAIDQAKLSRADPVPDPVSPQPDAPADVASSAKHQPSPNSDGPRQKLHPLGKAGVVAISVGVPALASGVALAVVKETRPAEDKSQFRDVRPTGYALLATGGLLTVGGIVMLVLDRRQAKRGDTVVLTPLLGPGSIGLKGRF